MTERPHLVIVRAGDESLHREWLKGGAARSWDLIVNYYGDDPDRYREDGVARIDSKGPKWPALHGLMASLPDLGRYSHVWLPDDDLLTDAGSINRLFQVCAEHGLEAAQPALSWDSYSSHLMTLRHANSLIRYTNFVEIMAPCLSAGMLARAMPLFATNLSGWGLDFVWSKLAENPGTGVGVVDAVTVRHTRPVGGPNYEMLRAKGVLPETEFRAFCVEHGIEPTIIVHKALDHHGRVLAADKRERWFAARLLTGCLSAWRLAPERKWVTRRMAQFAWEAAQKRGHRVYEVKRRPDEGASLPA